MRHYGATMQEITRREIEAWPEGESFALHPYAQDIALNRYRLVLAVADDRNHDLPF
jgi:hypothetical protein